MKKLILIVATSLLITGCSQKSATLKGQDNLYDTVILGECEYWQSWHSKGITHKGDCPNPIHKPCN